MLILNKLYIALTNPIETAKRPRVPPLLKRGDIVMNGDVFRPEEDMFKSCVIHFFQSSLYSSINQSLFQLAATKGKWGGWLDYGDAETVAWRSGRRLSLVQHYNT